MGIGCQGSWETVIWPVMPPRLRRMQLLLLWPELNKSKCTLNLFTLPLICCPLSPFINRFTDNSISSSSICYLLVALVHFPSVSLQGTKCLHPSLFSRLNSLSVSYLRSEGWWCHWTKRLTCSLHKNTWVWSESGILESALWCVCVWDRDMVGTTVEGTWQTTCGMVVSLHLAELLILAVPRLAAVLSKLLCRGTAEVNNSRSIPAAFIFFFPSLHFVLTRRLIFLSGGGVWGQIEGRLGLLGWRVGVLRYSSCSGP